MTAPAPPKLGNVIDVDPVWVAKMTEEALFEYHLYSLDRPTTIAQNQTKQVALLTEPARRHPQMKTISRETIRRILKKTSSNPGAS